ncbi:ABC transporter permease [Corynebacterium pacaense]|uniref:ABC transporter permease n=1 Tax=Corynebacterium pacaense TaxID=1816684 RepID=UPI0009B9A189|nr:ABC transporter permease [Corynebacterium pacaense]
MIRLAFAQLRRRGFRYASLFFAIFASVALTVAALSLTNTLITSVNGLFAKPYVTSNYVITATAKDREVADDLDAAIRALPGVRATAFDELISGALREPDGIYRDTAIQSIVQGPLQWRTIDQGRLPEGPGEIAVATLQDAPAVGTEVFIKVPEYEDDIPVTVVGSLQPAAHETLGGPTMLYTDPAALAQWGNGGVRGEFRIATAGGAPALPEVPGTTVTVETAGAHVDKLSDAYLGQRNRYFLLLAAFVGVAAVVAALIVFSAYSVLTGERRREFGLIRAVGASTTQILGSVIIESAVLGVLASALGAPAGLLAARLLAGQAERFGIRLPVDAIGLNPSVLWLIVAAGAAMSVLAALPAALSVCSSSTIDALGTPSVSRVGRWRPALWFVLAVLAATAAWWLRRQVPLHPGQLGLLLAILASAAAMLGILVVSALVLPALLQLVSRGLGRLPLPTLQLGLAFAGKQRTRSAALVAVILAGSALSSAVLHGQSEIRTHLLASAASTGGADVRVSALDEDVSPDLLASIREVTGVTAAQAPAIAGVKLPGGSSVTALMLDSVEGAAVMRAGDTGAAPGTIVLGKTSGYQASFPEGAQIDVEIAEMPVTVTVAYRDDYLVLIDPGVVATARELKADDLGIGVENLPAQPVRNVFMLIDGPADQPARGAVVTAVRERIAGFPGRYSVSEAFPGRTDTVNMVKRITIMSSLLAVVAMVIAAVGLINTVVLMVAERARDRWLLRSIGLTRTGQILVLCTEMVALALPSAAIGAVSGGIFGLYVARAVTGVGARDLDPTVVAGTTAAMVIGAVLCAVVVQARRSRL